MTNPERFRVGDVAEVEGRKFIVRVFQFLCGIQWVSTPRGIRPAAELRLVRSAALRDCGEHKAVAS